MLIHWTLDDSVAYGVYKDCSFQLRAASPTAALSLALPFQAAWSDADSCL